MNLIPLIGEHFTLSKSSENLKGFIRQQYRRNKFSSKYF